MTTKFDKHFIVENTAAISGQMYFFFFFEFKKGSNNGNINKRREIGFVHQIDAFQNLVDFNFVNFFVVIFILLLFQFIQNTRGLFF